MTYTSVIQSYGVANPKTIKPHPLNMREHPKEQYDTLVALLNDIGFLDPIIVNLRTNHVINGHLRLQVALDLGIDEIDVIWIDIDERQEPKALATFDPVSELATIDPEKLALLCHEIDTDNPLIQSLLADLYVIESELDDEEDGYSEEDGERGRDDYTVTVRCPTRMQQSELYDELKRRGYKVESITR